MISLGDCIFACVCNSLRKSRTDERLTKGQEAVKNSERAEGKNGTILEARGLIACFG
jgi:hypothetical protein